MNVAFFRPYQLRELYDGADVNEVVRQSEQKGRKYGTVAEFHISLSNQCIQLIQSFIKQQ